MITINKVFGLIALILLVSGMYFYKKDILSGIIAKDENKEEYRAEVFNNGKGWGYKIFHVNKIVIVQFHIPAVNGLISFKSEKEAIATANLSIFKIKNGVFPPTITLSELDSLKISY